MKKRVLSLVLALSMTVSVLPVGALADNIPRGGVLRPKERLSALRLVAPAPPSAIRGL